MHWIIRILLLCFNTFLFAQSNDYDITKYGAKSGDNKEDTKSIQKAIDACFRAGGGEVIIPPGDFITGPLFLKDYITFTIQNGATLWCTEDITQFYKSGKAPTPEEISAWKGLHTDFQLINGENLKNVTIKGKGTIHGQGQKVWWGKHKIRPYVIRIEAGENIAFEDVTVKESPFHTFNFTRITNLNIRRIVLRNDPKSPNTDGLHIAGCRNVKILGVDFETGDDCLLTPGSEDVLVANSRFKTPWGVWWPSRSCKRITITNCVVDCQMLVKDFRDAEDVIISNIVATGPGRMFSSYGGTLKNVLITNVVANGWSQGGWFVNGEQITLDNVHINRKPGSGNDFLRNGFDFKQVDGLTLRNVTISNVEKGPGLYCENVSNLEIDGFKASGVAEKEPAVWLNNVSGAYIHDNRAEPDEFWAQITGSQTNQVVYTDNHWNGARIQVENNIQLNGVKSIHAQINDFDLPETVSANDPLKVIVTLESIDQSPGLFPITLEVDGEPTTTEWIWLQPTEKKTFIFLGPTLYTEKKYAISLNKSLSKTIQLLPSPPKIQVEAVELEKWDRILKFPKSASLKAQIKNIGSVGNQLSLGLLANEALYKSHAIFLNPGQKGVVDFNFQKDPGLHNLSLGGAWNKTIKVYDQPLESSFLYYPFNENDAGSTPDLSGLGYHGAVKHNEGGNLPVYVSGVRGNALKFNGESAYVEIPSLLFKFPMTLSLWIKPGSLTPSSTAGRQMILYASEAMGNDGYGPEPEIHLMRAPGNTIVFWSNVGNKRVDLRAPFKDENEWIHVAIVYDKTSSMYFDGKLVASFSGFEAPDLSNFVDRIYIGRPNVDYLRYFNGALDELYFFNEALDEEEIRELSKGD